MSHVTVMAAPAAAAEPPLANPAAAQVLAELQSWSARFSRGRVPNTGSPLDDDERFAVQRAGVRAAGLGRAATSGELHATDRRAWVRDPNRHTVRHWAFAELAEISALANWGGLTLIHPDGAIELVVSASPHPPTWRDAPGWLKVEGAFAAGRGRLEPWISGLPRRLSAAAGG